MWASALWWRPVLSSAKYKAANYTYFIDKMGTTRVVSCDSLYRLLSNNELLAAFANAGFTPPGTPEAKKEPLLVLIDAMQRLNILSIHLPTPTILD